MLPWFERLADVPGIGDGAPSGWRRILHLSRAVRPRVQDFTFDGRQRETLLWPSDIGETSASPAQRWQSERRPEESDGGYALRQLEEALEQPGTVTDYHFRIQGCCNALWSGRREHPELIAELERLCLLDLRLIEAFPAMLQVEGQPGVMLHVEACHRLVYLYEREGYLHEALVCAQRGQHLNQATMANDIERLRGRIARLEGEHAP